jgi:hypothetical protein
METTEELIETWEVEVDAVAIDDTHRNIVAKSKRAAVRQVQRRAIARAVAVAALDFAGRGVLGALVGVSNPDDVANIAFKSLGRHTSARVALTAINDIATGPELAAGITAIGLLEDRQAAAIAWGVLHHLGAVESPRLPGGKPVSVGMAMATAVRSMDRSATNQLAAVAELLG